MVKEKTLYMRTRLTWNIDGSTLLSMMLWRTIGNWGYWVVQGGTWGYWEVLGGTVGSWGVKGGTVGFSGVL